MKAVHRNSCNSRLKLGFNVHAPSTSNSNCICFLPPPNSNARLRIFRKSITKMEVTTKEGGHLTLQMNEEAEPKESGKEKIFSTGEDEEEERISRIPVPSQRYIPISKPDLLNALLRLFNNEKDAQDFLYISKCLESILHAEHKSVLEEMCHDYTLTRLDMKNKNQDFEDRVHGSSASLVNGRNPCNQENKTEYLFSKEQAHEWHLKEMNQQMKSNTSMRCDFRIPNGDMRWQKIADLCERFLFSKFKEKIEMPIDKAMSTLLRLGLVTEDLSFEELQTGETSMVHRIKVFPFEKSYNVMKEKWGDLLH